MTPEFKATTHTHTSATRMMATTPSTRTRCHPFICRHICNLFFSSSAPFAFAFSFSDSPYLSTRRFGCCCELPMGAQRGIQFTFHTLQSALLLVQSLNWKCCTRCTRAQECFTQTKPKIKWKKNEFLLHFSNGSPLLFCRIGAAALLILSSEKFCSTFTIACVIAHRLECMENDDNTHQNEMDDRRCVFRVVNFEIKTELFDFVPWFSYPSMNWNFITFASCDPFNGMK